MVLLRGTCERSNSGWPSVNSSAKTQPREKTSMEGSSGWAPSWSAAPPPPS